MATQGGPTYDLTEWEQYRQSVMQLQQEAIEANQLEVQNTAVTGDVAAQHEVPEIPPEIPPAFNMQLVPEANNERVSNPGDFAAVMNEVDKMCKYHHEWLKGLRTPKESTWALAQAYYDMAEEQAFDKNRRKSDKFASFRDHNSEMEPERCALMLPVIYEAVQQIQSKFHNVMRGSGLNIVELLGEEKNDIPEAKLVAKYMNYQYRHEIETEDIISDMILDGLIIGTGVVMQSWDSIISGRKLEVLDRQDIWWDESAPSIQQSKVVVVRREISLGELYDLKNDPNTPIWFSKEDIDSVIDTFPQDKKLSGMSDSNAYKQQVKDNNRTQRDLINPRHKKLTLDVIMDTEPWRMIYRVNEKLIVGVSAPLIPANPQLGTRAKFPLAVFAPIRKQRSIDGDSFVARALDPQDMVNAIFATMVENIKGASQGIGFTSNQDLDGADIEYGKMHFTSNPQGMNIMWPEDHIQTLLNSIDWITNRVSDRISGVTDASRGQAAYSGMTASATRDLINQSANRTSPQEKRAVTAMQDIHEIGLVLNSLYLNPEKLIRILGEQAVQLAQTWGSMDHGVSGKDLVPTGFPGSMSDIAQKSLQYAAVIGQTGGNPIPLMKAAIENDFNGKIHVDEIYPQNGVGNDPVQENMNVINGIALSRDPDDMDMYHIQTHVQFMASEDFKMMEQQNPMIVPVMTEHIRVHASYMQQMAQQMGGNPVQTGGMGPSGQSQPAQARPKSDGEREAQMTAQGAGL